MHPLLMILLMLLAVGLWGFGVLLALETRNYVWTAIVALIIPLGIVVGAIGWLCYVLDQRERRREVMR